MNFSSENFDAVHPAMMQALVDANTGFESSYGKDSYTLAATKLFKEEFGEEIAVYFTFNGTGANNFALAAITESYQSIFCADIAHCYVDEATAPEAFSGCRLYPITTVNGKITLDGLQTQLKRKGDVHHPQANVVTLTQPTEYGTIYSLEELRAIKAFCVSNGLLLHVDGARFFNAAAALNVSLKELSEGVDVLTLGGTKLGMMYGEAVIFFASTLSSSLKFTHKRSMQLASKNRYISVQFQAILREKLWLQLANYTNHLAKCFEKEIKKLNNIQIIYPVQSNVVFLKMSKSLYLKMQSYASFYYWDEQREEARLVFSFSNTLAEIKKFVEILNEEIHSLTSNS
ncbi:threonine aldolase family protein [Pedobacter boryungensis]|uniref:Aminotransferase class I/II-fold pyridoxal phosphate-dependent enzyme n=1 Tax=Pedobacter boryungensis TaxID=869962 RepID=A0ABX2DGM4_9SPHI|nr:aminotransferase class I/II-fold pyridoxal phosphate-dependent enzyme [Pedobacter boryungensis]NQX32648.1 aminotransferase class I/II-fold pyridoxal phosphate-dependent enzyme [Pedobacter boryungensis]